MLIEPNVRPSGGFIQPATVRYGFGSESLEHATSSVASVAKAESLEIGMTAESARRACVVQGAARA
jgi:hypothetical protein